MFSKKFSSSIRRKKRMIISSIVLLVVFLGIGYSAFTTNLGINGTLNVSKYDQTLYGVLEKAVSKGYAREYTGTHQDSMAGVGSKKIYHWYAPTGTAGNALATEILDKNNVIFANHCWQMIRTTDTGGVKMIYNGEVENYQCLNTRGNHVGYGFLDVQTMSTTYYFGTSYTYDKANNLFSLSGTITTGTIEPGQYTCKSTSSNGTCSTLYLINSVYTSGVGVLSAFVLTINGNNSHYSEFGESQFNVDSDSPAYAGYMYNTIYLKNSRTLDTKTTVLTRTSMSNGTNYYYGTGVTYDTSIGKYTLTGISQNTWTNTYATSSGLYTCKSATETTCTSVYYISVGESGYMYGFVMDNGNLLNYYNTNITFGTDYTKNNETYTLTGILTVSKSDWATNYSTYKGYYTCENSSTTCTNLKYITAVNKEYYKTSSSSSHNYIYANDFVYNNETNTYSLDSSRMQFFEITDSTNKENLKTHRYTCFNTTGECQQISYIYFINGVNLYYITIKNGKSVSDALEEMLSKNDVNTENSTIKAGIDAWYKRYMTSYTSSLEDVIYCNDRKIHHLNSWDPDGGTEESLMFYSSSSNNDLSCANITDKFSLSNPKAQLTYPVGLLTYFEANLLKNANIRKTGRLYTLMSPYDFYGTGDSERNYITSTGALSAGSVSERIGIRPVISLKPGTEYVSGTGSMADPYVVE